MYYSKSMISYTQELCNKTPHHIRLKFDREGLAICIKKPFFFQWKKKEDVNTLMNQIRTKYPYYKLRLEYVR